MGKQATSRARRSVACEGTARRARGPPVRYRDKPAPTPERDPLHADRQATEKKRPRVEKILLPPAVRLKNEKRPFPLRTKNRQRNPKQPLDRKSPIQVCEPSVPRRRSAGTNAADVEPVLAGGPSDRCPFPTRALVNGEHPRALIWINCLASDRRSDPRSLAGIARSHTASWNFLGFCRSWARYLRRGAALPQVGRYV